MSEREIGEPKRFAFLTNIIISLFWCHFRDYCLRNNIVFYNWVNCCTRYCIQYVSTSYLLKICQIQTFSLSLPSLPSLPSKSAIGMNPGPLSIKTSEMKLLYVEQNYGFSHFDGSPLFFWKNDNSVTYALLLFHPSSWFWWLMIRHHAGHTHRINTWW